MPGVKVNIKKSAVAMVITIISWGFITLACHPTADRNKPNRSDSSALRSYLVIDTNKIPNDKFGDLVRYGRNLLVNTAYYIGPNGVRGKYLGNKMNCTNCHQDAGTKPWSFNLITAHKSYPQYRGREGKVLTLAERINNCVMRPHNGRPLPLEGDEMVAMLSYFKWISTFVGNDSSFTGEKNMSVSFPAVAADPLRGGFLFARHCARCHGNDGEGKLEAMQTTYIYPPLWGSEAYQSGSSMHRVIKQAQWLKGNMPFDKAKPGKPFLTDQEAVDIAAFVNNDSIHKRPSPEMFDYPNVEEKAIDYDRAPFADTFSTAQHKYGPWQPVIDFWKQKGVKAVY